MGTHPRQLRHRYPPERGHPSVDAQLLFWRSDARGSVAAGGSWRSARFRYYRVHHGRAAVVTPKLRTATGAAAANRGAMLSARREPPVERLLPAPRSDSPSTVLMLIERVAL